MGRGGSRKMAPVRGFDKQFKDVLALIEESLSSVDGGPSRIESLTTGARDAALGADPLLSRLYETTSAGLDGGGYGGLPSDFADQLLTDVRSSQAARGVLDSDTSAIEEAAKLLGGRETIRSQRMAQAQSLLTSGLIPTSRDFMPSASELLNASMGVQQMKLQRNIAKKSAGSAALGAQGSFLGGAGGFLQGWGSMYPGPS